MTTVDELKQRIEELKGDFAKNEALISHIPGHRRGLQRHSKELRELRTRIEHLGNRVTFVGPMANTDELEGLQGQIKGLAQSIENWRMEMVKHGEAIAKLRTDVDSHENRISGLEAGQSGLIETVAAHSRAIASATGGSIQALHPVAWALAALSGILFGGIWAAQDWSQKLHVHGIAMTVPNTAAGSWWAATVVGVAVGLFVLLVLSFFLTTNSTTQTTTSTTTADASAATSRRVASHPPRTDPPTQAMPAAAVRAVSASSAGANQST